MSFVTNRWCFLKVVVATSVVTVVVAAAARKALRESKSSSLTSGAYEDAIRCKVMVLIVLVVLPWLSIAVSLHGLVLETLPNTI